MDKSKKHIICYSGGHTSAIVAIEVARKFGKENCILVNHECKLEEDDVARFEKQIAGYLQLPITYVNFEGYETKDQFDVCLEKKAFINPNDRQALCTHVMKTEPFMRWLNEMFSEKDCIIYYGFELGEKSRIQRRATIMAAHGYKTDFPLAMWNDRTINDTNEIGIEKPNTYNVFKHANCIGCLKAGWQHWYCFYVLYPHIYQKASNTEQLLGYSIHKKLYLEDLVEKFDKMIMVGIKPTEHIKSQTFWANVKKKLKDFDNEEIEETALPCECAA